MRLSRRYKLMLLYLVLLSVSLTLLAVAFAQQQPADPGNPSTWFLTAGGWGGIVMVIVSLIKTNFLPGLRGVSTLALSLLLSVGGAFLASTGLLEPLGINLLGSRGEVFTFGLTAFVVASGGWDTGVGALRASRRLA